MTNRALVTAIAIAALSATTLAQFDVNGANASLTLNGATASVIDPAGHDVLVPVPGPLTLAINSGGNTNAGIILLGSGLNSTGAQVPTPWGGSVDLGVFTGTGIANVVLLSDGVGFTVNPLTDVFSITDENSNWFTANSIPGALANSRIAFQAIVRDATSGPFFFDNTEVADAVFDPSVLTVYSLGDDDSVNHTLTNTVTFAGAVQPSMNVCSNGFITFAAGSGDFQPAPATFFDGWGSRPNPGVAVAWSDLNPGDINGPSTYEVFEAAATGNVTVTFRNQEWWSSVEPAGTFSATFDAGIPGSVRLDYAGFVPGLTSSDPVLFGVTDGNAAAGIDTNLTNGLGTGIANAVGTYASASGPDSICELVPANTPIGVTTVQFLSIGTSQYLILP